MSKDIPVKPIDGLLAPIDMEKAPKDVWECEVCRSPNTSWIPTVAAIFREDGPQWRRGLCSVCEERRIAAEKEQILQAEREEKQARIMKLHKRAGLPEEKKFVKLSGLERRNGSERAFAEMERIDVTADRSWIVLYGDNNTGKSQLMAGASNRQNGLLRPTLYMNESLFFKSVRESWDTGQGEAEVMSVFKLPDIVMWDEFLFFDYIEKPWIYERVYSILEYLAEADKKVIFATNIMEIRDRGAVNRSLTMEGRCGKRIWARLQRRQTRYIKMENQPYF